MRRSSTAAEWRSFTRCFRHEFGLLPNLIREAADEARASVIAEHFVFIADALHHDHLAEDNLVWPLLIGRLGDSAREAIGTMGKQDSELAIQLERIRGEMHRWAPDTHVVAGCRLSIKSSTS